MSTATMTTTPDGRTRVDWPAVRDSCRPKPQGRYVNGAWRPLTDEDRAAQATDYMRQMADRFGAQAVTALRRLLGLTGGDPLPASLTDAHLYRIIGVLGPLYGVEQWVIRGEEGLYGDAWIDNNVEVRFTRIGDFVAHMVDSMGAMTRMDAPEGHQHDLLHALVIRCREIDQMPYLTPRQRLEALTSDPSWIVTNTSHAARLSAAA